MARSSLLVDRIRHLTPDDPHAVYRAGDLICVHRHCFVSAVLATLSGKETWTAMKNVTGGRACVLCGNHRAHFFRVSGIYHCLEHHVVDDVGVSLEIRDRQIHGLSHADAEISLASDHSHSQGTDRASSVTIVLSYRTDVNDAKVKRAGLGDVAFALELLPLPSV